MKREAKLLTVVSPCFNEEETISELVTQLSAVLATIKMPHEFVLVDDGSSDQTWTLISRLADSNPAVRGLRFSRNFGQQIAYRAGLDAASGDIVVTMDADLQDPPSLLPQLVEKWREGFDIVYAKRKRRDHDSLIKRFFAASFYNFMGAVTYILIPSQIGEYRLMDRRVVDVLRQMKESRPFWRGMVAWTGFRSVEVPYDRPKRFAGVTKFPIKMSLRLALDAIAGFSTLPLRLPLLCGVALTTVGLLYGAALLLSYFSGYGFFEGGAITFLILLVGGVNISFIGVLGEYVARLFEQTNYRPPYILSETVGRGR